MRLKFFLQELTDLFIRDNFKRLQDAIDSEPLFKSNLQFLSITVASGVSALKYPHHLGYQPQDIILLSSTNNADVTFHYDLFTATNLVFTTSAATTFRCLVGKYAEGSLT